jgi:hypothetical protein
LTIVKVGSGIAFFAYRLSMLAILVGIHVGGLAPP